MISQNEIQTIAEAIRSLGFEPFIVSDPQQVKGLAILAQLNKQLMDKLDVQQGLLSQLIWLNSQGKLKEADGGKDVIAADSHMILHENTDEWGRFYSARITTTVTTLNGFIELDGTRISFNGAELAVDHAGAKEILNDWKFSRYDTSNTKYTYEINFTTPREYYGAIKLTVKNVGTSALTLTKWRLVKEVRRPEMTTLDGKPRTPTVDLEEPEE
jgi:hypothetical protein